MKTFNQIQFDGPPAMVAAWPGMGNVGLISVDYLRKVLNAEMFAEMDLSHFFIPDSIIVKEGLAQLPDIPTGVFYYHKNPNIIVFESNAQAGGRDGITIIKTILDVARQLGVARIYTAAAFSQPMSHSAPSDVMCACNRELVLEELKRFGVVAMPDGYIAGLNGLLLGVAASRGIDASCFLGTIPSYATNLSYPKASLAILRTVEQVLGVSLDFTALEESIDIIDKQLGAIEERIRQYFPTVSEQEENPPEIQEDEVPKYIMDRIEKLFSAVKKDRAKAPELKAELTRWNIYDLYEHRFLDLFKADRSADD